MTLLISQEDDEYEPTRTGTRTRWQSLPRLAA